MKKEKIDRIGKKIGIDFHSIRQKKFYLYFRLFSSYLIQLFMILITGVLAGFNGDQLSRRYRVSTIYPFEDKMFYYRYPPLLMIIWFMLGIGNNYAHPENSFPQTMMESKFELGNRYKINNSKKSFHRSNPRLKLRLAIPLIYLSLTLISLIIIIKFPIIPSTSMLYGVYRKNNKSIFLSKYNKKLFYMG